MIAYYVCLATCSGADLHTNIFFVAGISVVLVAAKEDTFRDADSEVDLLHSLHPA